MNELPSWRQRVVFVMVVVALHVVWYQIVMHPEQDLLRAITGAFR